MKFKPTLNRVLVEKLDGKEQVTSSGLLISTQTPKNEAVIRAIGPGARYWDQNTAVFVVSPMNWKVGQKVWVPANGMAELVIDGTIYHLLTDDQILGTL